MDVATEELVQPHHSERGPYLQCEVCADYIIAPPSGYLCSCHRNGHHSASPAWPELDQAALYGLPGEIVCAIEPHSEADNAALLVSLLAAVGNVMGRGAHMKVGADRHHLNLNAVLVGETSKGRKGMSWGFVKDLMHATDDVWAEDRIMGGLSSGEGLIYAVRDRVTSESADGEVSVVDEGAGDKRLMIVEGEFAGPLRTMTREGNTLSVLLRQAWDGGKLATLTRNSPLKATDAHISIIGHITKQELVKQLSETDTANGFANRFLWVLVRRSKALPFGGEWHKVDVAPLVKDLRSAIEYGRETREIGWAYDAHDLWTEVYEDLSGGASGLFGSATSRAEAQTLRVAALYATLDGCSVIQQPHLEAALALWRYSEASARYIFGDASGDAVADKITAALEKEWDGLSRTDISNLFGRHRRSGEIDRALAFLEKIGRVEHDTVKTGGRPAERWFLK